MGLSLDQDPAVYTEGTEYLIPGPTGNLFQLPSLPSVRKALVQQAIRATEIFNSVNMPDPPPELLVRPSRLSACGFFDDSQSQVVQVQRAQAAAASNDAPAAAAAAAAADEDEDEDEDEDDELSPPPPLPPPPRVGKRAASLALSFSAANPAAAISRAFGRLAVRLPRLEPERR